MVPTRPGWRNRLPQTRWIALAAIAGFAAFEIVSGNSRQHAGVNQSFLPAMLAVVASANALTALVLLQKFLAGSRDKGRIVVIACAYLFAALMTVSHALAFPGLFSTSGLLAANTSTTTWLWVAWHFGFPAMLSIALLTGRWTNTWTVSARRRRIAVAGGIVITCGAAVAISAAIVVGHSLLPNLVSNGHASHSMSHSGMLLLTFNLAATVVTVSQTRRAEGMIAWVPVAALGSLADVALTISSGARYTVGWYSGRALSFVTANVILAAVLVEFFRIYRESEISRRVLEDEALDLLRENRAAHDREHQVRRVIENAADAYLEITPNGLIQAWNSKANEMFGWVDTDMVNHPLVETIMSEQGWAEFHILIDEFWASEERFDGGYAELLVRGADGREFPAEATMWVDEGVGGAYMSFFLRDITIRRETQERLHQALEEERQALARLQEIDRVKSNFVSSVSHELRSPLTNTLGYLELLADGDIGSLTEGQLHMVKVAQRNANRLYELIEDLLILSKVEEGAFSVRFRAVPMLEVLEEVRASNADLARERDINFSLDEVHIDGVCPGDAKQLTRAISNVVNNAIKFSEPGATVVVGAEQGRDEIVVTVRDTGIGIPPEERPKLFERFYRTSISVEQQHPGAGLGLTISKAIIEHHGGSIHIESELGKGTTVTLRLPALVAPPLHLSEA